MSGEIYYSKLCRQRFKLSFHGKEQLVKRAMLKSEKGIKRFFADVQVATDEQIDNVRTERQPNIHYFYHGFLKTLILTEKRDDIYLVVTVLLRTKDRWRLVDMKRSQA
jgi:hypothetical protein